MSENQENNQQVKPITESTSQANTNVAPNTQSNANYSNAQNVNYSTTPNIPNEYKPLSPWAYVGYNLLFSLPLVGFIMMIVFAFDSSNINRRNYARSFFCAMLIGLIITIVILILLFAFGFTAFNSVTTSASPSVF